MTLSDLEVNLHTLSQVVAVTLNWLWAAGVNSYNEQNMTLYTVHVYTVTHHDSHSLEECVNGYRTVLAYYLTFKF